MIPYIVSIFWCFFSFSIKPLRIARYWYLLTAFLLCVFLCFGYMTGSDWRSYEQMYENIDITAFFNGYYLEPGYYVWMLIFKIFHFDFWIFFIVTKIFVFLLFMHVTNKYVLEYRYLVWMVFLPWFAFYLFVDNPMRNLIAIAIGMYAFNYLINRKFLKFLLLVLLALSFHISAIVLIPMYYLLLRRIPTWVYLVLILCLMLFFSNDFIVNLLERITGVEYIQQKVAIYVGSDDGEGQIFSVKMFIHLFFFALLLWKRSKIEAYPNGRFILNASLFFILFYRIGLGMHILYRLQLYFSFFYCIGIALFIINFTKRSYIVYATWLLIISLAASVTVRTWKYVPYTNYLYYMFDPLPYDYRDSYNERNTPYPDTIK